jgi:hypothetical protein
MEKLNLFLRRSPRTMALCDRNKRTLTIIMFIASLMISSVFVVVGRKPMVSKLLEKVPKG